jgi:hypothetical protein
MGADRTPGVGTWIAAVLFFGGLAAGPGYYLYCTSFTGELVSELAVRPQDRGQRTGTLELDPAMNPLRIQIDATTSGWKDEWPAKVDVALYDGRTPVLQSQAEFLMHDERDKKGFIAMTPSTRQSVSLQTFKVPRPATYTLRFGVTEASGKAVRVSQPAARIYRNTRVPNMKLVWSGVAVAVIAALLGWMVTPARVEN